MSRMGLRSNSYGQGMASGGIPEKYSTPVALAIGNAVIAASALEKVLLAEIGRRQLEADGQATESLTRLLTDFESQPAGRLLRKLREQGITEDLAERIDDVLKRRNRMIHGVIEDVSVAVALATGEGIDEVLARIEKIEADCGVLATEIQPLANDSLEKLYGISIQQAGRILTEAINLDDIHDPGVRKELENARALINLYGMPDQPDSKSAS